MSTGSEHGGMVPPTPSAPVVDDDTLDVALNLYVEESSGHWCDGEFRIEGKDLMHLLRMVAALSGVSAPVGVEDAYTGWLRMTDEARKLQMRHLGNHQGDVYHAMQSLCVRFGAPDNRPMIVPLTPAAAPRGEEVERCSSCHRSIRNCGEPLCPGRARDLTPAASEDGVDHEMIALALEYVAGDNTLTFGTDALRRQANLIRRLTATGQAPDPFPDLRDLVSEWERAGHGDFARELQARLDCITGDDIRALVYARQQDNLRISREDDAASGQGVEDESAKHEVHFIVTVRDGDWTGTFAEWQARPRSFRSMLAAAPTQENPNG